MDFLDPAKERRHRIGLKLSYVLVAVAIAIASLVLLYQTDGYCLDRKGGVNRCGLIFVSSQPTGGSIYLNNKLQSDKTNAKLNLEAGAYGLRVEREGYRPWQRIIDSIGGGVRRYDYIFMFPSVLQTETIATYGAELSVASQSPDKRWLVMAQVNQSGTFTVYDMRDAEDVTQNDIAVPATVYTPGTGEQTWEALEWSKDNTHLLLKHTYTVDEKTAREYILLNRADATESQNISKELNLSAEDVPSLFDKRAEDYYVYNTKTQTLRTTSIDGSNTALVLEHVFAYKTVSDDTVLYVSDTTPDGKVIDGKVSVILLQGNRSQVIRQLDAGAKAYLLDMAEYENAWYVAIGSSKENGVRIYEDPLDQPLIAADALPAPVRFLRVAEANRVSFSSNARFIMTEKDRQFMVYDLEYDEAYTYTVSEPVDSRTGYASWMDGHRLYYVSGSNLTVRDYDNQNIQALQPALPGFSVFFDTDYSRVFSVARSDNGAPMLTATDLRVRD